MNRSISILLAVLAVIATAGLLWFSHREIAPQQATWENVLVEASGGGYELITTEELWRRYQKSTPPPLLVDTRQEWEYRTGHIKGAVNLPMEPTWLSRWRSKGALQELLGPDKDRFIVFY